MRLPPSLPNTTDPSADLTLTLRPHPHPHLAPYPHPHPRPAPPSCSYADQLPQPLPSPQSYLRYTSALGTFYTTDSIPVSTGWLQEETAKRVASGEPQRVVVTSLAPVISQWVAKHPL